MGLMGFGAAWDLGRAIAGASRKATRDRYATVTRRDPDGVTWGTIAGASGEVPLGGSLADAEVGDVVAVDWRDGRPVASGNATSPSVGARRVEGAVAPVRAASVAAQGAARAARSVADAAQQVAEAVNQHFWTDDSGVHVTQVTQEAWGDSEDEGYHSGPNVLINSLGQLFRDGLNNLLTLTTEGNARALTVWDGLGNAAGNVRAIIGETITLGNASDGSVVTIDSDSMDMMHGTDEMLHFGYGLGAAESGTAVAPYYTIGRRAANSTVGNYSVAEGRNITASGYGSHAEGVHTTSSDYCSHAEGHYTTSSSYGSHAEGYYATASGNYSHSEGVHTTASGYGSHSEGYYATASGYGSHSEGRNTTASGRGSHAEGRTTAAIGDCAHAQNEGTVAAYDFQTAIGKYNANSSANAFEIGNGTADDVRSNALTVGWDGTVDCGGIAPKWVTIDPSAFFSSVNSGWANDASYTQLAYSPTLRRVVGRLRINSTAAHSAGNNVIGTVAAAYRPHIRALCCTTAARTYNLYLDANGNATLALDTATTATQTEFYLVADYTMA